MFKKLEVNGVHTKLDDDIKEYVNKKIGGLDIYLSSHSVKSAHVEVYLKEVNRSDNNSFQCEVEIHLPKQNIFVKENALSLKEQLM